MTQTAHAAIKRAAVSSISILQVCAFLVCLLGIGMQLRLSGLLRLTLSLWTGSLLLVLALMIYNLIAPSWFVQFIPKIDLVLIGEFTALMNALLLVASKGARLVTMPGIPKPLEV